MENSRVIFVCCFHYSKNERHMHGKSYEILNCVSVIPHDSTLLHLHLKLSDAEMSGKAHINNLKF